jgi:uncharacterized protein YabN with tetrapyrrole methylase and pyrophosphatase domain
VAGVADPAPGEEGGLLSEGGPARPAGSLTVVGTGLQLGVHLTPHARAVLERADEVLYLVTDPLTTKWIERLNPNVRSLARHYEPGKDRSETYADMVEEILSGVRAGLDMAVAFYGHPGVFVDPGHAAVGRAREEGFPARMLPAISSEDCLFADLGIDPGGWGCQSYEATALLVYDYRVEPRALLVLWQVGFLGQTVTPVEPVRPPLELLVQHLERFYPSGHETILYEAASHALYDPFVERLPLCEVASADVPEMATLVVPPATTPTPDLTMIDRLGLPGP